MDSEAPSLLQLPSFLRGTYLAVSGMARREGERCAAQYLREGFFPAPRELSAMPPGEVVVVHEVADFQRERPAWRLYLLSNVLEGLCEALDWRNAFQVSDLHEAFCRETPWGALHAAVAQEAPRSTERTALRLRSVLRFWEPLQSARYLYKTLGAVLTLEGLLEASHDWVLQAWCPVENGPLRTRLEMAAERMAQATREDSEEVLVREVPRALPHAQGLKHRSRLADPSFVRQRVAALDPASFERISGACTSDLLEALYDWDRELEAS
ncbi:hypothetical protein ACN28S_55170 [Cystobacter fuscus]